MKVLLIKTSSLGDLIHTFPAITDAHMAVPNLQIEWVVEEAFQDLPLLHPAVKKVHPIALRRLRKRPLALFFSSALRQWRKNLASDYDLIIDAQGLMKSAWIAKQVKGSIRAGFANPREFLARFSYHKRFYVDKHLHAIARLRLLFSNIFNYSIAANDPLRFGLQKLPQDPVVKNLQLPDSYWVFLHGTTWESKHWPTAYWIELAKRSVTQDMNVVLPFGNPAEQQRAEQIKVAVPQCIILPKMKLAELATVLAHSQAVISVDSGLGHLAAAFNKPVFGLYGATNTEKTGIIGENAINLTAQYPCSPCLLRICKFKGQQSIDPPCYQTITPNVVWEQIEKQWLTEKTE